MVEKIDPVLDILPPLERAVQTEDDDDVDSNASEDLLANEDLDLNLDDTPIEPIEVTESENVETSRLSNTTLTSVSMIEASQPAHHMTKSVSVNNRTDFNCRTMDQTSVVESDIVSANDDTDVMSDASDNLLDDQDDLLAEEPLDLPVEVVKAAAPAPVAALLLAENIDSPVFRKGRPKTPVEFAIRNNSLANESKELCLLLDSSVEDSPIFRKKNSSVCSSTQNNSGFIKSLIENDEQSSEKDEQQILDVTVPHATCVEPAPEMAGANDKENDGSIIAPVTKLNKSVSVRRRSSTPEEVISSIKEATPCKVITEIIAEVVSPVKSSESDSGPMLPETQALRVDEEELSDEEIDGMFVEEQKDSEIKPDEQNTKIDNVVEEETLGKGKRVRKLTPKAEKLKTESKIQDKEDSETPVNKKDINKSRKRWSLSSKSVTKDELQVKSTRSRKSEAAIVPEPEKSTVNEIESNENTAQESDDLIETPLAPATNRLKRGKRGMKASGKDTTIKHVTNASDVAEVDSTNLEPVETQPWVPSTEIVDTMKDTDEEPTQPYERDPEVLLPGQSGIEVDTYAETQPLEETVNEEPVVKKGKISDGYVPPVKKSSRRSQVPKTPLDHQAPSRNNKRKSAIEALADLQPASAETPSTSAEADGKSRRRNLKLPPKPPLYSKTEETTDTQKIVKQNQAASAETPSTSAEADGKSRRRNLKLPPRPLLDSKTEETTDIQEIVIPNQAVNKLGRRRNKLKMPSSLLIESPAAEDMFVDDADQIPSPLTNGTPVIPFKSKSSRKFRSKAPESETVADALEAIKEDEPLDNKTVVGHASEEEPSLKSKAVLKRGGRSRKTVEVAAIENVNESEEVVEEKVVEVQPRRGRTKKVEAIDSSIVETQPVARGRRKNVPVNSTVAVMEVEEAPIVPPAVSKRGARGRRTEPVNVEPLTEEPSSRRTRNTSGASTASTTSNTSERNRNARTSKALPEPEPTKESRTGRKDSETSTVSNHSVKSKKGKTAPAKTDSDTTVISSSSTGSRGRKRPAEETPEGSSSKRRMDDVSSTGSVRSRVNDSMDSTASPSLRKVESLTKKRHLVMFTGYNDQADITLVKELNGSTTESLTDCTVLVTDQIKRTAKFLSMVGKGVPIVAPLWLTESKKVGKFLNPWDFILKDQTNEKKWGFKLEETLKKASRARLLSGLCIHVTGQVKPSPEQCKDFIECGGAEFIETLPTEVIPGLHIVSCAEDKKLTSTLAKEGVPVMDKEWMLSGLLKYKLDKKLKLK
eukprot:GFUD01035183.1.p1 GENE.GFUD01035183.1~~GFUD01035183.1.p1  ORF type:complete len:1270 (-),score=392.62 GFUD01035183.1:426-4235(-)